MEGRQAVEDLVLDLRVGELAVPEVTQSANRLPYRFQERFLLLSELLNLSFEDTGRAIKLGDDVMETVLCRLGTRQVAKQLFPPKQSA